MNSKSNLSKAKNLHFRFNSLKVPSSLFSDKLQVVPRTQCCHESTPPGLNQVSPLSQNPFLAGYMLYGRDTSMTSRGELGAKAIGWIGAAAAADARTLRMIVSGPVQVFPSREAAGS
jgi:hypothetical protein